MGHFAPLKMPLPPELSSKQHLHLSAVSLQSSQHLDDKVLPPSIFENLNFQKNPWCYKISQLNITIKLLVKCTVNVHQTILLTSTIKHLLESSEFTRQSLYTIIYTGHMHSQTLSIPIILILVVVNTVFYYVRINHSNTLYAILLACNMYCRYWTGIDCSSEGLQMCHCDA